MSALVYRAHDLEDPDDARYRALQIQMSKWRKHEPGSFDPSYGTLLGRLVEVNGGASKVASDLGMNHDHLAELSNWSHLELRDLVAHLPAEAFPSGRDSVSDLSWVDSRPRGVLMTIPRSWKRTDEEYRSRTRWSIPFRSDATDEDVIEATRAAFLGMPEEVRAQISLVELQRDLRPTDRGTGSAASPEDDPAFVVGNACQVPLNQSLRS